MAFRLPIHKHDAAAADALASDPIGAAGELPALLEWMQDANWPVAQALAPLLPRLGASLVPALLDVLRQRDATRTWHTLSVLAPHLSPAQREALAPELRRMATNPTPTESAEDLPALAQHLLYHARRS